MVQAKVMQPAERKVRIYLNQTVFRGESIGVAKWIGVDGRESTGPIVILVRWDIDGRHELVPAADLQPQTIRLRR